MMMFFFFLCANEQCDDVAWRKKDYTANFFCRRVEIKQLFYESETPTIVFRLKKLWLNHTEFVDMETCEQRKKKELLHTNGTWL